MKMHFGVWFKPIGKSVSDNFELSKEGEVKDESEKLCDALEAACKADFPPIPWEGTIPSNPEEQKTYQKSVRRILAPLMYPLFAKSIEPVLNEHWEDIDSYLFIDRLSDLRKSFEENSRTEYEFRPELSLCRPCGPGCHEIDTKLFEALSEVRSKKFMWSYPLGDELFNYFINCRITFKLVSE